MPEHPRATEPVTTVGVDLHQAEIVARAECGEEGALMTDESHRRVQVELAIAVALATGPARKVLEIVQSVRAAELSRRAPTKRLRPVAG